MLSGDPAELLGVKIDVVVEVLSWSLELVVTVFVDVPVDLLVFRTAVEFPKLAVPVDE